MNNLDDRDMEDAMGTIGGEQISKGTRESILKKGTFLMGLEGCMGVR